MERNEFQPQMSRLVAAFGKNTVTDEHGALIWRAVKDCEIRPFVDLVDGLIGEDIKPKLSLFQSWAAGQARAGYVRERAACTLCEGSGWVIPDDAPMGAIPVAMRCQCAGGPQRLASALRGMNPPDPELAERVERTFDGISAWQYKKQGYGVLNG